MTENRLDTPNLKGLGQMVNIDPIPDIENENGEKEE